MNIKRVSFLLWLLPMGLMLCIFFMSSQNGTQSNSISIIIAEKVMKVISPGYDSLSHSAKLILLQDVNLLIRKITHFSAYFILCLFWLMAVGSFIKNIKYNIGVSLLICLLFAISDELHQYYVLGRTSKATDVLIDFLGALLMSVVYYIIQHNKNKKKVGRGSG